MSRARTLATQLRDSSKLIIAATHAVTDTVEAMHHRIASGPLLLNQPFEPIVKALTAPSYKAIRHIVHAVGQGIDLGLAKLSPLNEQPEMKPGPLLAAINGVWGDYLAVTQSSLAIEMTILHRGQDLLVGEAPLAIPGSKYRRIAIFLHGSSTDESCWQRKGFDYAAALENDCGLLPLHLRYNSGLHISQNGRALSNLLQDLVAKWPTKIEEIIVIGHSMGGLIARSACHYGETSRKSWRPLLSKLITLGSPHHGSPLEQAGNWLETVINLHPYSEPIGRLGRIRSAGITDLRYGNILDEDWIGKDRFQRTTDPRVHVPLPSGVECYAIAATLGKDQTSVLGDGLVPVKSALGIHQDPRLSLDFPESRRAVIHDASHLDLLSSDGAYRLLSNWCRG